MDIESKLNDILNKFPHIKKVIKRAYQLAMYSISPKVKYEGDIKRISPKDGMEYFFGYYDKSPWDASDRYMLCLRVKNATKTDASGDPAEIILFDTQNKNSYKVIAKTNTWNVQQGCMLQWLGPDFKERIIYNDFRDGNYCSIILDLSTNKEKVIEAPVYTVSRDGNFALSLDFSRLHRLRKGYGYSNKADLTREEKCPDKPCIWYVDLRTGYSRPILKYTDFRKFETRHEMKKAEHKVNHIMINPSGERFMVLHRWIYGSRKYTRLITANIDGSDMYNLNDDNMTSHCWWKNDSEIIAFAHKKEKGNGYYLFRDKTKEYRRFWPELSSDGHPSCSPDGSMVVTDTYPDRKRLASIYLLKNGKTECLARVFAPFKYDNDVRCDLHPRWNMSGDKICFDAAFEGKRGLYYIDVK